ncbi:beta-N-acetylhexosaminidase [Sinosporangium album]|uniref:Beta-N-acetylhexosaminidase n=1 Tax=Sinosporangium album TaxID=504805 RepID=A0A1G7T003_9ACTN|nr:glycoside hydrolase family 3 N-terminal domain-containing protein [Sinosporangium album]SDG27900.1 beta-N-acetylhexosaminidase [Sinosporangium album]
MPHSPDLARLALTVLQPGFDGSAPPAWLRRALSEGLGGAVLFARNIVDPDQTADLIAAMREDNPAVVVAVDEEGGVVTRMEAASGSSWPGNRALGTIGDPSRTERVAAAIGHLLASVDVTLDYAPSVDVNADPDNPVIGIRSFGDDPGLVAEHGAAWIRGLQSTGVAACAKHFPGHGDTVADSHLELPTVHAPAALLRQRDLLPFRAAIDAGVRSIMCGHLLVPALDPAAPATLSRPTLTGLLRDELGFTGMLVTDAIEMRAVAALHNPGEIAVRALIAGADAICVGVSSEEGESVYVLRDAIVAAVHDGRLSEERLAEAASRVVALAVWHADFAGARLWNERDDDVALGLATARDALRVTLPGRGPAPAAEAAIPPLAAPPLVIDVAPRLNLAVAPGTPTGLYAELLDNLPGTLGVTVRADSPALPDLAPHADRPLILVVHDAARHGWAAELVAHAVRQRPDTVVVETGMPGEAQGSVYIATNGISRASAQVVAHLLVHGQ